LYRFAPRLFLLTLASILLVSCSMFTEKAHLKQTKVVAVLFGQKQARSGFKAGIQKPYGYVVWGDDVPDGSQCNITISNVTKAQRVYERHFLHDMNITEDAYNYEGGKIIELNPLWYKQIGRYKISLIVNGKRKSESFFSILP